METSSHALQLGRLEGLRFQVGAFTNLTQDHLDFHQTMDAYFEAKALLFREHLQPGGTGVIFVDDPYGPRMAEVVTSVHGAACLRVSLSKDHGDVRVLSAESRIEGITATLATPIGTLELRSRLVGRYNLANLAVATGMAIGLGLSREAIEAGLSGLPGVPGRIERVEVSSAAGHPTVLVDYAHTHDALENVIAALRPIARGRILCVFGCGGDRDRTKRPRMGRVVARDADVGFVTSDNPRTEEPGSIVEMILEGVREVGIPQLSVDDAATAQRGYVVEVDRRAAIHAAVLAARPEDIVLVAGKGHEDYQIIGKTKFPFDDREIAREALALRADVAGGLS
jgi:UDP-N-acetylmuramoyl-L-alanyl-D-glutamate--2,6-diaminopimelate ligase